MKIIGFTLLLIASLLYANLVNAVECTSDAHYQLCVNEPGEHVFADVAALKTFVSEKKLVWMGTATTNTVPNAYNRPMGAIAYLFVIPRDGIIYSFGRRSPGGEIELIGVLIPIKDV